MLLSFVRFMFPYRIFYMGVPGYATDCLYGVACRGLTTCLLYMGPLFGHFCLTRVAIIRWTGGILSWNCSILFITVFVNNILKRGHYLAYMWWYCQYGNQLFRRVNKGFPVACFYFICQTTHAWHESPCPCWFVSLTLWNKVFYWF